MSKIDKGNAALDRRSFLHGAVASAGALLMSEAVSAQPAVRRGGTLRVAIALQSGFGRPDDRP
jgi:hypothetical protein